jgi:hypothetical protein
MGGDSVGCGRADSESGTLGCLVVRAQDDQPHILSCFHVLGDVANPVLGAEVWQPGSRHGGSARDRIGQLAAFSPIQFGGFERNKMDAALAAIDHPNDVRPGTRRLGAIHGWVASPGHDIPVQKEGQKTGPRSGTLYYQDISFKLTLACGKALFDGQYGVTGGSKKFAEQGDSGAIVLDEGSRAVGMLIGVAAGMDLSLVSPIQPILNQFRVEPA